MIKEVAISDCVEQCFHCGDRCDHSLSYDDHFFCCIGCKGVYQLLSQNNLCGYYTIENNPGLTQKISVPQQAFAYLDDEKVAKQIIQYQDAQVTRVIFFIPAMHCSSCIWLLEHLYKLNKHVLNAKVNFLKKELHLSFDTQGTSLREMVTLLSSIGYEPSISLNDLEKKVKEDSGRRLSYQIGVAGFCFGNIMLVSFPEYFGLDSFTQKAFSTLFGYLNLVLSLPVFFYSAQDYFIAAYKGLRNRYISIDVPLALGILTMFVRSCYEVLSATGPGWFDTHAGLVFFLLVGKWFQQKTFDTLSFERDYKSYFPIAVTLLREQEEIAVPVTTLSIGDRILIRNNEIIPADAILLKGDARIDFSFVTGESEPVSKVLGEIVYAGGRQKGATIELEVCKKVSQSYLTQLWNNETFLKHQQSSIESFQQMVSRYFTIVLLFIAFSSAIWWLFYNPALSLNAFTSVLIIACPCALALSSPFALGTAMRILGRNRFYLKSPMVLEQMAHADTIVFDKTGTITEGSGAAIVYNGTPLRHIQRQLISSAVAQSIHPLSQKVKQFLAINDPLPVIHFNEVTGRGIEANIDSHILHIGSREFVPGNRVIIPHMENAASVFVSIDGQLIGCFEIAQLYRKELATVLDALNPFYRQLLLSGDHDKERSRLAVFFKDEHSMHFNQSPSDKLKFITDLQQESKQVIMVGDGLNDAGALKAANIGISITDSTSHFSPASDVIMEASEFAKLPAFLRFSKQTLKVIHLSFVISFIYNIIGLSFAVQGTLSPLIAAVLMPVSSVTVISFTTISTTFLAKRNKLA